MSSITGEKPTRCLLSLPKGGEERLERWEDVKSHLMNVILSEAKNL